MKRFVLTALVLALAVTLSACTTAPSLPDESIERVSWEPDVASLPQDYTIAQLRDESELVIVGRVIRQRNVAYPLEDFPDRCCSHVTIRVEDVLSGEADGFFTDVQDVWYIDEETGKEAAFFGIPMMRPGHRVLLFLKNDPHMSSDENETIYTSLHGGLGTFFADENGVFYPAVTFSENYKAGHKTMTLADMAPRTLDEIREEMDAA